MNTKIKIGDLDFKVEYSVDDKDILVDSVKLELSDELVDISDILNLSIKTKSGLIDGWDLIYPVIENQIREEWKERKAEQAYERRNDSSNLF